ncbi:Xaa-pro dipeptidase protein [Rutstroemia sp. NJR-2017a BVV2]|nr:Xaa-pro dipeptidase protein [Rutstroemia sp. NJR-2017a BVV2]PQE25185.1 Xaa-pro dipeptidase protein [Rutstroemia sp. NJR-2017a BVV2]
MTSIGEERTSKQSIPRRGSTKSFRNFLRLCLSTIATILLSSILFLGPNVVPFTLEHEDDLSPFESFRKCSIEKFIATGLRWLDGVSPISKHEFMQRRNNLAVALKAEGIDAFIIEPGYTFQYYGNVSQRDWEVWEPEERPFLMIVSPRQDESSGNVVATTTFLAPHFEEGRVRMLGMPFEEDLNVVTWEEHWNPYVTLLSNWYQTSGGELGNGELPKVMVDEEMRDFIQRGLAEAGFTVVGLEGEVRRVKQTKTSGEVDNLRAVNTGTVEALRAMRKCLLPGLTENEVMKGLDSTMRAGGMEPFFDIVLFDENAAMPHGGPDGTKVLEAETLILIDVGAHLNGYSSDICRTFFPPFFPAHNTRSSLPPIIQQKIAVWETVFDAQTQALHALIYNGSCASVDLAARKVITDAGYGQEFTHRVGHGIGLKAHESPYLHKGNTEETLRPGMAFTLEPGIYLEGKFGVRHEDVFLVKENGEAEILTGSRAQDAWNP